MSIKGTEKKFNLPAYIQVPFFLYQDLSLDRSTLILASFFYSLHTSGKKIKASNDYMSQLLKISVRNVQGSLVSLENKKYVKRIGSGSNRHIIWLFQPESKIIITDQEGYNDDASIVLDEKLNIHDASITPTMMPASPLPRCQHHPDNKEDNKDITTTTEQPPVVVKNSSSKTQPPKTQLSEYETKKLSEIYEINPVREEFISSLDDFLSAALYSLLNREEKITRQQRLHGIIKFVRNGVFEEPALWAKEQRRLKNKKIGDEKHALIEKQMLQRGSKELGSEVIKISTNEISPKIATQTTGLILQNLSGKEDYKKADEIEKKKLLNEKQNIEKSLDKPKPGFRRIRLPEELRAQVL